MNASAWAFEIKDSFYRCQFAEVLAKISQYEQSQKDLYTELALIKANTLFELHRVAEAKDVLAKAVIDLDSSLHQDALYAKARLQYMDHDHEKAYQYFDDLAQIAKSKDFQFKSLIGKANVLYSLKKYDEIPLLLAALGALEPLPEMDQRITLALLRGNCSMTLHEDFKAAKDFFLAAMNLATKKAWNFFIVRGLYGLANMYAQKGDMKELAAILEILSALVNESESRFFSHLVNQKFKHHSFSIPTPIEFDYSNHRIMLDHEWIPLHDKPKLFLFLALLHEKGTFMSKEELGPLLWEGEGYLPRVHGPRIFDIAKRARSLIERYENQPVVLLSSRLGYKLAST